MSPPHQIRLAIIDDYAGIARRHFEHIPNITIDEFPTTLDPFKPADLDRLVNRLSSYHVISSMRERTPFPAPFLARLPNLRLLLNSSRRNKGIDLLAARTQGILVTGTTGLLSGHPTNDDDAEAAKMAALGSELPPPEGYAYVVQHAWSLLLALCSRVVEADGALRTPGSSTWQSSGFATSLAGKTLGVIGLGKLGVAMARIGVQSFGMRVLAWSENLTAEKAAAACREAGLSPESVVRVAKSKDELMKCADVVSLHNVLSDRSRGMIGEKELQAMKKTAFLVNTSRAGLIDEEALIKVMKHGSIGGVALDVFWEEPLGPESPWRSVDEWSQTSVVLSPHMGYAFAGLMHRFYQEQAEILEAWIRGETVSPLMT